MRTVIGAAAAVACAWAIAGAVPAVRPSAPASAPAAGRSWARLYAALSAGWRPAPELKAEFDAPASTSAVRSAPAPIVPPDSEAVKAGERRGLTELLSASVSP